MILMKSLLTSLLILFVTVVCINSAESKELKYKNTTFTTTVGNVRLQAELADQGKENSDKVSVTVPAVIFDKPIVIEDVRKVTKSQGKEIDFLVAYHKANIEGDKEKILSFWHPAEKEEVSKDVNDPELLKHTKEYMTKNPGMTIHGIIKQKSSISVITGTDFVFGISIRPKDGKLFLTNKPDNDLELAIIEGSFMKF